MEQLTEGLSRVTLDPEGADTYKQAFDKLVSFAEKIRRKSISSDELLVTKQLAGPFTPGGLLVLLQEPLQYHDWGKGVDFVIADCNTLDSLDEGIRIGSEGKLGLNNGVSVLDLRPFLSREKHSRIQDPCTWEELYGLVFSAIEAKQPRVLLCMGKVCGIYPKNKDLGIRGRRANWKQEASNALAARKRVFGHRYQHIEVVSAIHPSRSVNYNSTDSDMREGLLQSICEAVKASTRRPERRLTESDYDRMASGADDLSRGGCWTTVPA